MYAIYTSGKRSYPRNRRLRLTSGEGSTGKPKGVDVSHGNVTNALLVQPGSLGISVGTKVGQVLNVAFDMGKCRSCHFEYHGSLRIRRLGGAGVSYEWRQLILPRISVGRNAERGSYCSTSLNMTALILATD